jgi:probable HAF family extracellular repeat protein
MNVFYSRRHPVPFAILLLAGLAFAIAAQSPAASAAGSSPPINSYIVTNLGSLDGPLTEALDVNDAGEVVGRSWNSAQIDRAFLWKDGVIADLGTLPGGTHATATAINNLGQVVGWSRGTTGDFRAFLWDPAAGMRDLGHLGGAASVPWGINDAGQVVGWSRLANGQARTFLWQAGRMFDLGTLPGATGSTGFSINASGQVAGRAWDEAGNQRPFRWHPSAPNASTGTMAALSVTNGYASGLNDAGVSVGWSAGSDGEPQPALWDNTGAHLLPLAPPENPEQTPVGGVAKGINNLGYVVGTSRHSELWFDSEGGAWIQYLDTAVIWDSANGVRRLSALTGFGVSEARAVNASGQIIGLDYLLSPSPLPVRPSRLWVYPFVEDGQVSLHWTPGNGATSYTVKRAASTGGPYVTVAADVTGTNYVDTAVANGSRYYYVVTAVNAYGESANSHETVGAPLRAPEPPTGLKGMPGDQQVTLSWNAVAGADLYDLYRSTTPGGPYVWFAYTSGTSLVDYGDWDEWNTYPLNNGTTYYYVVTATNGSGRSGYSNEASATPVAPPSPPAPTGLTAAAGDQRVTVSWNASDGATYYNLWRATTPGGPYTHHVVNFDGTQWTDSDLANGTTYYYVVTAGNTGGVSPNSSEVSATPIGPPPPAAPTALAAAGGKKKVSLTWKQSTSAGVTQNRIYRSTTSGGGYTLRATISAGQSFSDTGLSNRVTYYYRVTAVNSSGKESTYSNQASAKPR